MSKAEVSGKDDAANASPFISVMVLNYNYGDLLERALEGCAAQTFRDFEIIMINNGAIDNTEQVYQSFCKKHPGIKTTYVLIEKNQGPMHGWNEGLPYARGAYVMFHDADDWMEPDCLEKLAEKAKETGADRVTGQYREVQSDGSIVRERKFRECRPIPSVMLQSVIFKKSVIVDNQMVFPESLFEKSFTEYDLWFVFRFAIFQNDPGVIVEHVIYNYYFNPRSLQNITYNERDVQINIFKMKYFIDCAAETIKRTGDEEIKQEIEYILLRVLFSYFLRQSNRLPWISAKRIRVDVTAALKEKLPDWHKNHYLWPIGNGYSFLDSLGLYVVVLLERLHAAWMLRLAAKLSRLFKFRR